MLPDGRRLGAHLALGHGMVKAADRAVQIGASAIQVFSDNPSSWRRRPELPRELPAFRERLAEHDIAPIAIHAPYLVNLAGRDEAQRSRSIEVMVNEVRVANAYGAAFLNLHIGSHRGDGTGAGVDRVADGLRRIIDGSGPAADGVGLVLENGTGGGHGLGSRIEELAWLDEAIVAQGVGRDRFAFCLDTAHLWGAGYAIGDAVGVDSVVSAIDGLLGLDRVVLVHLNDNRRELGSFADRHEHLGAGRIGAAGLARMLTHPALAHATYLLETPGMDEGYDAVNLERARDLAAGRPLAELPPEAFHTRSGKSRTAPATGNEGDKGRWRLPWRSGR